jgi:hypothetical protein
MADKIQKVNPASVEVDGSDMEINPAAVESVTTAATHPADKTPAPVELPTDVNRPPISTNRPDVPIAHSNITDGMGPTPEPDYHPELGPDQEADYGAQAASDKAAEGKDKK